MSWRRPSKRRASGAGAASDPGLSATPAGEEAPAERDVWQRALDTAVRYLGTRPRSEREIRQRLARAEVPPQVVEDVLQHLRQWDLADDAAFARYWVEQRHTFRPRGARALKAELRQRGVAQDVVDDACGDTEESAEADAYRAAARRAQQMASLDEPTFRARLGQFLARRGFDWGVVQPTVERLWRERNGLPEPE